MNKELLVQLSTGDWVRNTKTNHIYMIGVISQSRQGILSIYDLNSPEDWILEKSRLVLTNEEKRRVEKYHEDVHTKSIYRK
jgi:hypothetical protein